MLNLYNIFLSIQLQVFYVPCLYLPLSLYVLSFKNAHSRNCRSPWRWETLRRVGYDCLSLYFPHENSQRSTLNISIQLYIRFKKLWEKSDDCINCREAPVGHIHVLRLQNVLRKKTLWLSTVDPASKRRTCWWNCINLQMTRFWSSAASYLIQIWCNLIACFQNPIVFFLK